MGTPSTLITVRETEQLVDALNEATELDCDIEARIEFLLQRLRELLNRTTRCALWLLDDFDRKPAPHIAWRTVLRPTSDEEVRSIAWAQRALDEAEPMVRTMVHRAMKQMRTPVTLIASESGTTEWYESVLLARHLSPIGYTDCIASLWAATPEHGIILLVHRNDGDPPFTEKDTTLVSLMLRAAAPIVDRDMARRSAMEPDERLSQREREILLMLLSGVSEKQIAAALSRSVHTVHTYVQQIYRMYEVSSRGELMARFVDKAVVESLRLAGAGV